jgi:hypothetical protein
MTNLTSFPRFATRHPLALDLLCLCIGVALVLIGVGYLKVDTAQPGNMDGDHLFILAMIKSYMNGHGFRLDDQLAFPDVRDNLYFPSFDLSYRLTMWFGAHIARNPFRVVHLMYVSGLAAMFSFGYWMLRRLSIRRWLALVGAAASVMTPFFATRTFGHDFLALSFSAPLGLGLALSIGLAPPEASLKRFLRDPFTITAVVVVGISGLYYAFYTLMFMGFAGVAGVVGQRRWFPVLAFLSSGAALFMLLILSGYGFDLPLVLGGQFVEPHRLAFEQIMYGINLPGSALRFSALPHVVAGVREARGALPYAFNGEGPGEWPLWPMTLVLLGAPLTVAICQSAMRIDPNPHPPLRVIALTSLLVVFAILFGVSGGLGFLFNLIVSPQIRADARLMPFLNVAAIVILCSAAELAAFCHRFWVRAGAPVLVAILLGICLQGAWLTVEKHQQAVLASSYVQEMRVSMPAVITTKNTAKLHTILQMPTAGWPETPPIHGFNHYNHQLAYVFDTPRSGTRWSYGANEAQPWYNLVDFTTRQPPVRLPVHARALGFDGLLIEKSAYEPAALKVIEDGLSQGLSPECRLYEDKLQVLYALVHSPNGKAC